MEFETTVSPHLRPRNSVTRVMLQVLLALLPGAAAMIWFFGPGVAINLVLALITAEIAEAAMLLLRRKPLGWFLGDLSALVTAALLALALPPLAPWWLTVVGTLFAIVIAKHLYGGLGYNPFNPAMVGYVVLLISFPKEMTQWLAPHVAGTVSLSDTLALMLQDRIPQGFNFDAVTMATPLDTLKTELGRGHSVAQIRSDSRFGLLAGAGWEWAALAYLAGGLWLLARRVIAWQIPCGFLAALAAISGLFYLLEPDAYPPPLFHLFAGATMLGAFFIATDPVSAATSPRGRLLYGAMIGLLVFVIRSWGGYPDAVAFAVLLMNLAAPTIDYYTRPRVFGHSRHD